MDLGAHGQFELFGQFLEIQVPHRLVRSYVYNVPQIRESITRETMEFKALPDGSELTIMVRHFDQAGRDGHLNSVLEGGAGLSYDALEQLMTEMTV